MRLLFLATTASAFVHQDSTGFSTVSSSSSLKKILQHGSNHAAFTNMNRPHVANVPSKSDVRTYDVSLNAILETGVDPTFASIMLGTAVATAMATKESVVYEEEVIEVEKNETVSEVAEVKVNGDAKVTVNGDAEVDVAANVDTEEKMDSETEPEAESVTVAEPVAEAEPVAVAEPVAEVVSEEVATEIPGEESSSEEADNTVSVPEPEAEIISPETPDVDEKIAVESTLKEEIVPAMAIEEEVLTVEEEKKESSLTKKIAKKVIMPWKSIRDL